MTNNRYSYKTKLEAIQLLNEGVPGKTICRLLGLKSDGLIYKWLNMGGAVVLRERKHSDQVIRLNSLAI